MNLKNLRENLRDFTAAGRLVLHTYTSPRRNAWSAPVPATPQLERVPVADIVPHGDELHVYLDTWPVRKP